MILSAAGWEFDDYQERYTRAEAARAGHQAALKLVADELGISLESDAP